MITHLYTKYHTWKSSTEGATAIEYGLIAAGIAVAISAVVFTFGTDLAGLFTDMSTKVSGAKAQ